MNTKTFDLENELRLQAKNLSVKAPRDLSRTICAAIASTAADELQGAADGYTDISSCSTGGAAQWPTKISARGGDWGWTGFAGAVRKHGALWGGIGGAVAAAVVGAFVFRAPAQVDPRVDATALAQELRGVPQRVFAALDAAPAGEDPLDEEATALTGSAKSALGFLAYNFLPVTNG